MLSKAMAIPSSSVGSGSKPLPSKRPQQLPSRQWSCSEIEAGQQRLKRVKVEHEDPPESLQKREDLKQMLQARLKYSGFATFSVQLPHLNCSISDIYIYIVCTHSSGFAE